MITLLAACGWFGGPTVVETTPMQTLVIGHRGSPGHLPDHTLEGYRLAVAQGADFIEPDLVPTRDGVLVARHENDLSETTDVSVRFPERQTTKVVDGHRLTGWFTEDFTLAELRTLRAVQPYASRPHEHDGRYLVPTFAEILEERAALSVSSGREIGLYPELKHPTYFASIGLDPVPPFLEALRGAGLDDAAAPVFVQCFEPTTLERVGEQLPVRRVLLVDDLDRHPADGGPSYGELLADLPSLAGHVEGIGVHTSHVWTEQGPNDLVQRAHAAGLQVHVYTFRMEPEKLGFAAEGDPRLELRRFLELGVDGVFADYPDVAVSVREAVSPR